ncbi:hypothetical protein BDW68DRAFT_182704 [Aspergillus falconensis]
MSTTITLNLTGTILSPNSSYSQDTVHILLDAAALNALTDKVERTLTEAGRISGDAIVCIQCEDVIVRVLPTPETKMSHEVLKGLKTGDHVRRLSTLQVHYEVSAEKVFIWHVSSVDSSQ